MLARGKLLDAPRSFGANGEHVSVRLYDADGRDVVEVVAFGEKKAVSDTGKALLALKEGESVSLPVRVSVRNTRLSVVAV